MRVFLNSSSASRSPGAAWSRTSKVSLDITSGNNFISLFTENQLPGASSWGLPSGAGSISLGRK